MFSSKILNFIDFLLCWTTHNFLIFKKAKLLLIENPEWVTVKLKVVQNFLKNLKKHVKKRHTGRPCFKKRQKHTSFHWACLEKQNCNQIKGKVNLKYTCWTVHNVLQRNRNVRYAKLWSHPSFRKRDKKLRLKLTKKHVSFEFW